MWFKLYRQALIIVHGIRDKLIRIKLETKFIIYQKLANFMQKRDIYVSSTNNFQYT